MLGLAMRQYSLLWHNRDFYGLALQFGSASIRIATGLSGGDRFARLDLFANSGFELVQRDLQFIVLLEVQPELRCRAEVSRKTQRGLRSEEHTSELQSLR